MLKPRQCWAHGDSWSLSPQKCSHTWAQGGAIFGLESLTLFCWLMVPSQGASSRVPQLHRERGECGPSRPLLEGGVTPTQGLISDQHHSWSSPGPQHSEGTSPASCRSALHTQGTQTLHTPAPLSFCPGRAFCWERLVPSLPSPPAGHCSLRPSSTQRPTLHPHLGLAFPEHQRLRVQAPSSGGAGGRGSEREGLPYRTP